MKILIVEDEPQMLENMRQTLKAEAYLIESATTFHEANDRIGIYDYDCILLDIGLPDGNGLELLKTIKAKGLEDGVIIVSAKDSLDDKLMGLNLGADDYLPKPFHMAELRARVKAILRRRNFEGQNTIEIENVRLNIPDRILFINDNAVELNRKEYDVLLYFLSNKDRLVNKTALAEHVWGDNIDQTDSFDFIYSQIKNLRKKLDSYGAKIQIKAVYGIGYKLQKK
ncbi:response regulator transcription factor [Aequorivita echinoideorum]|uniref:Response regulator transcription factor n=1 Tax=Aequorivita echinoideorum TaxID=1549647 RepID=A0ABS5S7G9_9FLAO|nr:response regulator transcription factor [Aequorivita echinoideorum]MBT0608369.1 response regulator transcription factor [Aequorivita echinoideorum]